MSAINPRRGSSGVHRDTGGRSGNQHQQSSSVRGNRANYSRGGRNRELRGKGDMRNPRETKGKEWERKVEESLFQRMEIKPPLSDAPEHLQEHFLNLESDLRHWSKRVNPVDKTLEKWDRILPHIDEYISAAAKLFTHDTSYYLSTEVDLRVWKYGVYQFITGLRGMSPNSGKVDAAITELCKKGIQHFKYLLINAKKSLDVQLEPIFNSSGFLRSSSRKEELNENEQLCYRIFIAMGDLYRYLSERSRNPRDAQMASNMYKGARLCDTTKSRPYHQLGLMAKTQSDIIGTIYNYTRAYCTVPEIEGIIGNLRFVYDDIYKRFNAVKSEYWYTLMKTTEQTYPFMRPTKLEKWMIPVPSLEKLVYPVKTLPPSKKEHLNSLTNPENFQQFSLAYAHLMGMLFTNIGTEALEDVVKEVAICFEGLLIKNNITFDFMVEIFGFILFMTDHLEPPPESKDDLASRGAILQKTYMREKAIEVALNMLIMLSEKLLKTIKLLDWDNPVLETCSAVLHVWCRWVKRRPYICSEIRKERKFIESPKKYERKAPSPKPYIGKFVMAFSRLLTEIAPLLQKHTRMVFPEIDIGITATCTNRMDSLQEYTLLDGFGDVIKPPDFDLSKFFHNGKFNEARLRVHFRLARIISFGCKLFPDLKHSKLFSIRKNWITLDYPIDDIVEDEFQITNWVHAIELKPIRSNVPERKCTYKVKYDRPDCNNARIIIKNPPKYVMDARDLRMSQFETPPITKVYEIWQDLQVKGVRVELYIRPVHIMLDTNIFIRNFHCVMRLLKLIDNPIIVPTVVLSELRGLIRGVKNGYSPRNCQKSSTHEEKKNKTIEAMELADDCSRALEFMNRNKKRFKVVTTRGEEVKMYNYRKQKVYDMSTNPKSRNDEKIMDTCAYLELKDKDARSKDSPLRITRNLVLLTGDRALRVRSFAQDIPACDIESFTKWMQDSLRYPSPSPRKQRAPR